MNRSWLIDRLGQASFSLVGVFNTVEEPGDEQHAYAVPASCFVYVRGGIGEFGFDCSYYEASRGSVFHMEADRRMTVSVQGDMPLEFYMILYSDASGEMPSEPGGSHSFLNAVDVEGDVRVLEEMLHNWNKPGKIEQFRSKALFYTFLSRLLACGEEDCPGGPTGGGEDKGVHAAAVYEADFASESG
ncbi:hypothetical protein [Paenibacillus tarimensis]|uniref:hypothetical protein n=1 Tax=Paenibacillus tarimensis TaxID=416012 RepID=UPI001F48CCD6|nr:hypothetical protein [Paenibacillus tarimensis]MCF2943573.1 hypothetical protein [Paenibacillus tarimensis]